MAKVRDPDAGFFKMFGRALARRCPRCGSSGVFASWFTLVEDCPGCGFHFEREDGYWIGAMIVNTTITFVLFIVVFVGGLLLTWPDPNWGLILGVTIGVNLLLPIILYPLSKTVWSAAELSWHPLEESEIVEAMDRVESRS
ncbi:MAG: DUF983 domain-containing protein [Acidimicrobiia bacterium]|nr:DUF983 domain-containing protein [Acidimicrobiia bacterium]